MLPAAHKKKLIDALVLRIGSGKKGAPPPEGGDDEATESDEEKSSEEADPMAEVKECARDAFRALKEDDEDAFAEAMAKMVSDYSA